MPPEADRTQTPPLFKIPEDTICYAYEGEVTGIIIERFPNQLGVIHCSEGNDEGMESKILRWENIC